MTWPAVFDGVGALVVDSSATDPAVLAAKVPGLTWIAPKLTGADTGGDEAVRHCISVWRSLGLKVGGWIYCEEPVADVASIRPWVPLDFVVYDVEAPYKADEGGHYTYAAELVNQHKLFSLYLPAAVTSYGAYKSSIDFGACAAAGWPILAQCYDPFKPGDEMTYWRHGLPIPGPYDAAGIHQLVRSLSLKPTEAVYRPESIDG